MRASAWLLGASWWAQELPFAPKFSYHVARFSGDNPETAIYERFDPLFWGNGLDNWWFGANGAYSWLNANLRAHRFIVDAYLSAQDIVQFQYVRASVDQINSAVQFGQGARFTGNQFWWACPSPSFPTRSTCSTPASSTRSWSRPRSSRYSSRATAWKRPRRRALQAWTTFGLGLTANF